MISNSRFRLQHYQIEPLECSVISDSGEKIGLQPKFIEVLIYLARHHTRIVPREELIEAIWGENSYVGEKALTNAIWHLRKKLVSNNPELELIETIRTVGYRLNEIPQWQEEPDKAAPDTATQLLNNKSLIPPYALLVIAIVLFSFLAWYHWLSHDDIIAPTSQQITKQPGMELFVSPSPDGEFLVYQWKNSEGIYDLYIKNRHQSELPAKQLTFDSAKQTLSVWSNDGKSLYFARKDKANKLCEIVQLQFPGNQQRVIGQCPLKGNYYYIDISPDDSTLAFHGTDNNAGSAGIYFIDLTHPELPITRYSCELACKYRDRDMAFSPNGKLIAVTKRKSRFDENIFIIDLMTNSQYQVTFGEEDIVGMSWHPGGKHLVFATQKADVRQGFVLNLESKNIANLDVNGFSYPEYARQSGELFYQQRQEKYQISSLELETQIATSPFPIIYSEFSHHAPDYSPAADLLVYVSNESGFYELWTANKDGSNRQQLTFLQQTVRYPSWSHGGDKIAFLAPMENGSGDKIHILDFNSRAVYHLDSPYLQHNRPSWSWDDKAVLSAVFDNQQTELYLFSLDTETIEQLTQNQGRYGVFINSNQLLYSSADGGLWQLEFTEGANTRQTKQVIPAAQFNTLYAWHANESMVHYHRAQDKSAQLVQFDLNTRQLTPKVRLPKASIGTYSALSFIPHSHTLLFTGAQIPQADIKMLQHPALPGK